VQRQPGAVVSFTAEADFVMSVSRSEADDRFGDQTYQKAPALPDSLPVAESGADWREFRCVRSAWCCCRDSLVFSCAVGQAQQPTGS
jgi:hypothetical protein